MGTRVDVNHGILTWAIERAGYEFAEFAQKFPNIELWMSGEKKPTVKQLEEFSTKVHLPFGYLFLPQPPKEEISFPFFRTFLKQPIHKVSINVYDTILDLQKRQDWLSDFLEGVGVQPLPYVGKFNTHSNYLHIVQDIRTTLGLALGWASACETWEKAIDMLTAKIEEAGTIVTFNGVVGNNTRRLISVEECRGFVLVNARAPFMFVNSADAKAAQVFTIVHELAHIWLGKSAGFDYSQLMPADHPQEQLCDQVAAEFLVPELLFREHWTGMGDIQKLSARFKVSKIVIARRALDLGFINKKAFFQFYQHYMDGIRQKKESQSSGGDFYATSRKRISPTFASYVNNAVRSGQLPYRDAYKLTGLHGDTYQTFITKNL